jgi:hypothetical protein
MSKKEVKNGYTIKVFGPADIIPDDAKFIRVYEVATAWNANTGQVYKSETRFDFLIPVKNIQ